MQAASRPLARRRLGVCALVALSPVQGRASTPPREHAMATLTWERSIEAQGCPNRSEVLGATEIALGRPVFVERDADVSISAVVSAATAHVGYDADLTLRGRDGELLGRRVVSDTHATCDELGQAVALVLALALQSLESLPEPQPPPTVTTDIALGGVGVHGLLPTTSGGVALRIDRRWARGVSVGASAVALGPRDAVRDGLGLAMWSWGVDTRLCADVLDLAPATFALCAGAVFYELRARGVGLDHVRRAKAHVVAGHAGLSGRVALWGPLALVLHATLAAPLDRPRFVYTDVGGEVRVAHRPAAMWAEGGIDLVWSLHE